MSFIPLYPPRPPVAPGPLKMLQAARRNLLEIWPESTFHQRYFEHSLFRRHIFVCNSPETVRQVFVEDAANVMRKSSQQVHALKPLIGDGLFISDGDLWQQRRRAIAPLTHVSRLAEFVPAMAAAAAERVAIWQAKAGAEIDVLAEMAEMTADVICRAIFGARLGHAHAAEVVRGFSAFQAAVGQTDLMSLLGLPESLPRLNGRRVRASTQRVHGVVDSLLHGVFEGDPNEASLVRALAVALGDDGATVPTALRNETSVLLMAGHETTANTLAWAWYLLSQDEPTWQRLAAEVDALDDPPGSLDDVQRLPFTRAVIDETLRLYPPVPIQARRSAEQRRIEDRTVPANSIIMLVPWLLHRHQLYWEQPDTFLPERFLPGGSGVPNRYAYVPFSIGPRICTGAAFALTETVLCLATLARLFRTVLRPGHVVMPLCRLSLRPRNSLPMRMSPRAATA
jgi:cytochrome P450